MSHAPGRGLATLSLLGAAAGFSTIAIFTTLLTEGGMPLLSAMTGRYVLAGAVLVAVSGGLRAVRLPRDRAWRLGVIGGTGQALVAFLSLSALAYVPAATLVFLFYTFPAWVALRAVLLRTERLSGLRLFSLLLSFGGVGVMVGWPGAEEIHPLGAALGLSAAVVYALFIPLIDRLRAGIGAMVSTTWVCFGAAVVFAAAALVRQQVVLPPSPLAWLWMTGLGVLSTAVAFTLFLRGLAVLGPVHTAIVTTTEPFFVATLAALVLEQPIRVQTVVGGSLIAIAVLSLQRQPAGSAGS